MRAVARSLLRAASFLGVAVVASSFFGGVDARLDLLADFRAALAVGMAGLCVVVIALRERWLTALLVLASLANAIPIAQLYVHEARENSSEGGAPLRVVLFNSQVENPSKLAVARFVADSRADFVVIQEATDELSDLIVATGALELVIADFRVGIDAKRSSALYRRRDSRAQTLEKELIRADATQFGMGFLRARFVVGGQRLTLLVPRFPPPLTEDRRAMRTAFFDRVVDLTRGARTRGDEVLIVADLNTTPFAADFRAFVSASGLRDSTQGFGYQPSWPAVGLLRFVRIPIDHLLCSEGFEVIDRRIEGDAHGSDHYPLTVELELRAGR